MTDSRSRPTVIISGASGYFGGIACQYFRDQSWTVLTATRHQEADLYFDLNQPEHFAKQVINQPVDLFIHAAAAHEVTCREQPYQSIFQNVAGTKAALDFCIANQISRVVYLSTFHVFGHPTGQIDELTQPLPANDYGLSHLQSEDYLRLYRREQSLQTLVLRPSNFFGVPVDVASCKRWTLTPLGFCRSAVEKKQIVLRTPGYQRRNFIAVQDICATIASAFHKMDTLDLLHLPGPETLSIRELAQLVQRVMWQQFDITIDVVMPDGEPIEDTFTYSSQRLATVYHPQLTLENFVLQLCQRLLKSADFAV